MRYVLTNAQMREADKFTIETLEVPSLLLMERAGAALAEEAERLCPEGGILCVCEGRQQRRRRVCLRQNSYAKGAFRRGTVRGG